MEGLNSKNKNIKGGCTYSFKSSHSEKIFD